MFTWSTRAAPVRTDFDCPIDLSLGEVVEMLDCGFIDYPAGDWDVVEIQSMYARVARRSNASDTRILYFVLDPALRAYLWRRKPAAVTAPSIPAAKPAGATCARASCNEFNPYAEPNKPDGKTYVCYRCQQSGWSVTWGPKFE